jgi:2-polyprenyl-6-methoxyphenol hydroxylase-like FAD-dependent oxidoreductase
MTSLKPGGIRQVLPVLVVGAGPVGLAAAADLSRRGVPVRCIAAAAGPSRLSRALVAWPRTVDVLCGLGGAPTVAERSMPLQAFHYYSSARRIARIEFNERTRPLVLPQLQVEELLTAALEQTATPVAWHTRLVGLTQDQDAVTARLHTAAGVVEEQFSYVVGCDGAGSTVREILDLDFDFDGATGPNLFLLADTGLDGPVQYDAAHFYCSPRGVVLLYGLPSGRFRVFMSCPADLAPDALTLGLVQDILDRCGPGGLHLHDTDWVSTFAVRARHTDRYRLGRVFLAGDAAHLHSPAGGHGMNCGITDAHNLAWKLALAWRGQAGERLLASYEPERQQVTRAVLRPADLPTRAGLVRRPHRVWLRDTAVSAASATRLLNRDYVPWLAGLRTRYRSDLVDPTTRRRAPGRSAEPDFVPGALVPDVQVWDATGLRRIRLSAALPHLRHTLLVQTDLPGPRIPAAAAGPVNRLTEIYRGLVEVRVLDSLGVLHRQPGGTAAAGSGSGRLILVRPDHHVAACRPLTDVFSVWTHLGSYLGAGATTPAAVPQSAG